MKLKMAKDSLFAVLLRSPWWISIGIAAAIAAVARLALPEEYRLVGMLSALPFVVIAAMAGWKALRTPSAARVGSTLAAAGALSWREWSDAIEQAFRRDGYEVARLDKSAADFELLKTGRKSLVSCKRWKAASTGVEPLRDLLAAGESQEAGECIYVTLGEVSANAQRFAADKRIRLVQGAELARLLQGIVGAGKRAAR